MIKKFDVQNLKIVLKTKEIKIEEAIPGQMVLAYDINNKKKCFRQITETHKPIVKKENQIKIQTKSGTEIITSKWHPTLVSKVKNMKYIRADQIKIKDSLVGDSNTNDHVVSIDLNPNINEEFIDLTVEEHHNYFTKTTGTKKVVIHNTMGFHTLLQEKQLPFDCFDSFRLNNLIFKHLDEQTKLASQNLAKEYGEPEWCSGLGIRNTHRCVSGDTTILTKQGFKSIKSLVDVDVEIWNGEEWSTVKPFKTSEDSPMLEIIFSDSSSLKVTYDHRWLIKNDRFKKSKIIETKELRIGDKLEKWKLPIIEGTEIFPHAYTHGFYCGDGSDNQSKPQYKNCKRRKEVRLYNEDKKCLTKLEIKENCSIRTQKNGSLRFYIPDDMPGKWIVPNITHTIKSRLEWLAGLFDADGHSAGILTSAKNSFLQEIKQMLAYTGIFAVIAKRKRSGGYGSGKDGFYYNLSISRKDIQKMMLMGFSTQRINFKPACANKQCYVSVKQINKINNSETYCLTEPLKGTALFNGIKTKQCALAPTVTNAIISGNVSPSVEPWTANAFARKTAKGTFIHRNKTLEKLLESKGQNTEQVWNSIVAKEGSVQHLTCLTKEEKEVFLTAREINQFVIVKLAGQRQQYIDQAQSINLFFPSNVDPKYFHEVHMLAWEQQLKTLYYCRTGSVLKGEAGTKEYKREAEECKACEG